MMPGMIDPRTVLGDRYGAAIEKVRRAIAVDPDYLGCGCCSFYAYGNDGHDAPFLDVGNEPYTVAEAKALLNRLASAIAMAEELSR